MNAVADVVHLLVRYRDPSTEIDTILEHQNIADAHGAVWFGKFGKAVGAASVDRMKEQIAEGVPTFLYVTTRQGGELLVHRARLEQLSIAMPSPAEVDRLVPGYYRQLRLQDDVRLWARLSRFEEISEGELDGLMVASSFRPVRESLHSSAPFLLVTARR